MENSTGIVKAYRVVKSYRKIAKWCNVKSQMSVFKWVKNGQLPPTEQTGETKHAINISRNLKKEYKVFISVKELRQRKSGKT